MKRSVFDNATIIPCSEDGLDNSICVNTGVNHDKIMNGVHKRIRSKKSKPVRITVKRIIIAAAAAALIAVVFSFPVVAENVYSLYCSVFGGDSYAVELENAKNAGITVGDPNLKIEEVNIGGDRSGANIIQITLRKKDGSGFVDDTFTRVNRGKSDAYQRGEDMGLSGDNDLELIIDGGDNPVRGIGFKALYSVDDSGKVMTVMIKIDAEPFGSRADLSDILIGKKIKIISRGYCALSVDEVIAEFDEINKESYDTINQLKEENRSLIPYDTFTNSFYYTDVICDSGKFRLVKGRSKEVRLPFEIEFTFDSLVGSEARKVDDSTLKSIFGNEETNGEMTVSSFELSLYAKNDGSHNGERIPFIPEKCYIETKDGRKYYMIADGCMYSDTDTILKCSFAEYPDTIYSSCIENRPCAVDTDNISKISINGVTVLAE